jgi:transglutaminase/protease-like cytokinesis protein 3
MRLTNYEALATADHVAKTLEGDCTEFAMLTAAMCRAEGVPSRTAVGLIYADVRNQPSFAFHMWTEVWADGEWRSLDATLGKGHVGATHLKICDQSWHDTRSMTPLFPVVRVLGRVTIEVLSVE